MRVVISADLSASCLNARWTGEPSVDHSLVPEGRSGPVKIVNRAADGARHPDWVSRKLRRGFVDWTQAPSPLPHSAEPICSCIRVDASHLKPAGRSYYRCPAVYYVRTSRFPNPHLYIWWRARAHSGWAGVADQVSGRRELKRPISRATDPAEQARWMRHRRGHPQRHLQPPLEQHVIATSQKTRLAAESVLLSQAGTPGTPFRRPLCGPSLHMASPIGENRRPFCTRGYEGPPHLAPSACAETMPRRRTPTQNGITSVGSDPAPGGSGNQT